jgi:hypothetical protein
MGDDLRAVDEALAVIRLTLDKLTARGAVGAAFEIARAQFAASIRASWPSNLSAIAGAIDRALADQELALSDAERAELRAAAEVVRGAAIS